MEKEKLLIDLKSGYGNSEKPVHEWDFLPPADEMCPGVRVYYNRPTDDKGLKMGFAFYAVKIVSETITIKDIAEELKTGKNAPFSWDPQKTSVECLFRGVAYHDCIRHLNFGDEQTDNEGYFYYPNLRHISAGLKILKQLEESYCSGR